MNIKLWYGDGFAGRSYSLQINGDYYGLGMNCTEDEAREKAFKILKERKIDVDISDIDFKWDGTL